MGHERLGHLPKSQRWRQIVEEMASFDGTIASTTGIASSTLKNVQDRLDLIRTDDGFISVVRFLIDFARNPFTQESATTATPLAISIELRQKLPPETLSESARIAQNAASDALAEYYRLKSSAAGDMFGGPEPRERWSELSTGAGFCEVARLFFSRFTQRYLNYFLEREASAAIPSLQGRQLFRTAISLHTDAVSKHAFESAKIAQSYSAGWFNKRIHNPSISDTEISTFIRIISSKLREEFRRESDT